MKGILICLVIFSASCSVVELPKRNVAFTLYSEEIRDSFDITITPSAPPAGRSFKKTVYYLDAGLQSGHHLRNILDTTSADLSETLFVGIAHRGSFQEKRRRDFIPPVLRGTDTIRSNDEDGHADRFYSFLANTVVPLVEKKYGGGTDRTIIGHSFGGLFAFYAMYKTDKLFNKYIALSPSLWVNRYNILEYEKQYAATTDSLNSYLFLSAGKNERLNFILAGNRRMNELIQMRKYKGLRFDYLEIPGRSHHNQVPESLKHLIRNNLL